MKKLLLFLTAGFMVSASQAQDLPAPSPSSKVEQVVGLTNASIEYSRPSMKGRTIFGDLVAYDEVWRLGANAATKFTVSTDIKIGGQNLPAGSYAVFATPSASGAWKVVFNSVLEQWGTGNYDASKNVASVDAKAVENPTTETFTMGFSNVGANGATITIAWENVRVDIPFSVATSEIAEKNIKEAIKKGEKLDEVYYKAANYYLKSVGDNKQAMVHVNKGLKVSEGYKLLFLRAQIHMAMEDKAKAIKDAEKALELAKKEESGWIPYIQGSLDKWSK